MKRLVIIVLVAAAGVAFAQQRSAPPAPPVKLALPQATTPFTQLKDRVDHLERQVAAMREELDAVRAIATAHRDNNATSRAAEVPDAILEGIRQHRLVLGMTLPQANQAAGRNAGQPVAETEEGQVYEWRLYRSSGYADRPAVLSNIWSATFRDGKIVSISRR